MAPTVHQGLLLGSGGQNMPKVPISRVQVVLDQPRLHPRPAFAGVGFKQLVHVDGEVENDALALRDWPATPLPAPRQVTGIWCSRANCMAW
jgi:hypothetical protein